MKRTTRRRSPRRLHWLAVALAAALACDHEVPDSEALDSHGEQSPEDVDGDGDGDLSTREWLDLTPPEAWAPTPDDEDPWIEERPGEIECAFQEGWQIEAGGVEVDTGACDYLSLSQPLSQPLAAGSPLRLTLWWKNLIATSPSEGHIAVAIDGQLLWEERVKIPGLADARDLELVTAEDIAEGALITLHVHNHGANTWRFQGLYVRSQDPI